MHEASPLFTLKKEEPEDYWAVEALYDLCFVPGRTALSSYRLRDGVDPVVSLSRVALDEGGFIGGAIRYWPVRVAGHRTLLLGPVAVHPTAQGEGLAAAMIRDSLAAAEADWERVLLVGDLPYYQRFGFVRLDGVEMPPPTNPERVLGVALRPGAWDGIAGEVTPDA
ncbi:GNAT family N-acetyltransferase [Thalassococcus sp. BH17M4-6]|uniref:GNAT family N-acetyltransferase n=1 Tax=Thalassococcus sp. BH17M4-6 TaxID=3413148 RepID=UPI003BD82B38